MNETRKLAHPDDGLSVVALMLTLAVLFIAYFALRVAVPELPLHVYEAFAWLPS